MKALAIITARGGSKRIPRKNIKEFCGEPIIGYSIKAALQSGAFDEVMVSTDDEEIAKIAEEYGAKIPFLRTQEASDDFATTSDVIREVLDQYFKKNVKFSHACCIYPTAPFVTAQKLCKAMKLLVDSDASNVMPVVAYSFPPQRAMILENGVLKSQYPQYFKCRSQDLEPIYHDAGQFYAFDVSQFLATGKLVGEKTLPIIVSELEVQDIDNIEDWKIAEMKYAIMKK